MIWIIYVIANFLTYAFLFNTGQPEPLQIVALDKLYAQNGLSTDPSGQEVHDKVSAVDSLYANKTFSPEITALLKLCLIKDPETRPSISDIIGTEFVQGHQSRHSSELLNILDLKDPIVYKGNDFIYKVLAI